MPPDAQPLLPRVHHSLDIEKSGKTVPAVLPTLRGKKEVEGKQALPGWCVCSYARNKRHAHAVSSWLLRVCILCCAPCSLFCCGSVCTGRMMAKDVDAKDQSVAAYVQRFKNAAFGGLQADIFEVRDSGACSVACSTAAATPAQLAQLRAPQLQSHATPARLLSHAGRRERQLSG